MYRLLVSCPCLHHMSLQDLQHLSHVSIFLFSIVALGLGVQSQSFEIALLIDSTLVVILLLKEYLLRISRILSINHKAYFLPSLAFSSLASCCSDSVLVRFTVSVPNVSIFFNSCSNRLI